MNRRDFLTSAACGAAAAVNSAFAGEADSQEKSPTGRMGVVIHSYGIRQKEPATRFGDALAFLEYARSLGAAGVQIVIGSKDEKGIEQVRATLKSSGLYLEGMARLPRSISDVERFESELRTAAACGVTILRTVMLDSRRYETFDTAEAFRKFSDDCRQWLALAKPVAEKHNVRLAVENHKDWRADDLVAILRQVNSPNVGVCVDTGNSIALLEEPHEVVEALAPLAFTTHFKDMGVAEYPDGFLLSEVPLGTGFLDLPRIIKLLRDKRPDIRLNLEMITRDPLKVPCLTQKYWVTMESLPARHLAETLSMIRRHGTKQPLPQVTGKSGPEQVRYEDDNVRQCLAYAREKLTG